ncbi:MAG TPA: SdpI family protein [Gammaproteobacteria bacterium]|nr:SdpI family protein [Gammaproteobacteria bacterium]
MSYKRAVALGFVLVLAAFAAAAWFYPQLPEMVPTHWNAAGQPNDYTAKPWGPFILPLVMLGTWILLSVLPPIAPRGYRLDRFIRTYGILMLAVLAALLVLTIVMLLAAAGAEFNSTRVAFIVIGALFVVLGNYLGKLRKNFFIGIRTPWTLASDEVWARTHRLGGWLFVLAGLAIIAIGALDLGVWPFMAAVGSAAVVPAIYSYFAYRQVERGAAKG